MPPNATKRVEALVSRINSIATDGVQVYWYGPTPLNRIRQAEKLLGITLPKSYRIFVETVGGGGIDSFSILGIPAKGNIRHSGSLIGLTEYWREDHVPFPLPSNLVLIQHCEDHNEPFCLDFSRYKQGECPVVLYYPNSRSGKLDDVAPTFIDFWERYCEPYF